MEKVKFDIYFNDGYDEDLVDDVCVLYDEAELWYNEKRVRYFGSKERFEPFIKSLEIVGNIRKIVKY